MQPEWKIEQLGNEDLIRITVDIKLEQVPLLIIQELGKRIEARDFIQASRPLFNTLSQREKEVLQLITQYHTNKEIATRLHIAEETAKRHRKNILRKLQCRSAKELAEYKGFYTE